VLDFGIVGITHYLTLELIDGTDLRAALRHLRVRGESLDPGLTSYVAHALASALAFASSASCPRSSTTRTSGSQKRPTIKGASKAARSKGRSPT
jgi:hypothetical protein